MGIAEDRELDRQLTECLRNGPSVQLVNTPQAEPETETKSQWLPVGAVIGDPNKTRADIEHPTPVLDRLRAAIADPNTDPADREAAREVLRISFHTKD